VIGLLLAGFGALILGLNLIMIWRILNVTTEERQVVVNQLLRIGAIATIAGFLVLFAGVFLLVTAPSLVSIAILSLGSSVVVLGLIHLVQTRGSEHQRAVHAGAWAATGIGIGFILSYLIVVYCLKCGG
jgi:hypothetical protein